MRTPSSSALTLLRHGEAELNSNTCYGWMDTPLSDAGKAQVAALAKHWDQPKPSAVFCSDLARSKETAMILADSFSVPYHSIFEFREIHFGAWEGQLWDDIYHSDAAAMQRWGENWQTVAPPGGETLDQFIKRVKRGYTLLCDEHGLDCNTLITAHAGSLRALSCHLNDQSKAHFFNYKFDYAVPTTVC